MDESDRVSLREFVVKIIDERDRQYSQRFDGIERSFTVYTDSMNLRLSGMNEIRDQLTDQNNAFSIRMNELVTRNEYQIAHKSLADQVIALNKLLEREGGEKQGGHAVWGFVVGIGGVVTAAVALLTGFFRHSGG